MEKMISYQTHAMLLYFIDQLPYEEALQLRKELEDTYATYLERTDDLQNAVKSYETAAKQVLRSIDEDKILNN